MSDSEEAENVEEVEEPGEPEEEQEEVEEETEFTKIRNSYKTMYNVYVTGVELDMIHDQRVIDYEILCGEVDDEFAIALLDMIRELKVAKIPPKKKPDAKKKPDPKKKRTPKDS